MKPEAINSGGVSSALAHVCQEAGGQFLAKVIGLPEIQAQAANVEEALALVTRNRRDFARIPGLVMADWSV